MYMPSYILKTHVHWSNNKIWPKEYTKKKKKKYDGTLLQYDGLQPVYVVYTQFCLIIGLNTIFNSKSAMKTEQFHNSLENLIFKMQN